MSKLAERVADPAFQFHVKQYRAVLDFLTDIEDEMRAQKMKRSSLAEALGKTRAWISKVFRTQPNLTFFTAVQLADALDMDVEVHAVKRRSCRGRVLELVVDNTEARSGPAAAASALQWDDAFEAHGS
jgi:transcriptional regulator with XRE-family HTH domain